MKSIIKDIPNAKLVLGGKIIKPYDPFKTAKKYDVLDTIIFKGWIDENDLPSYIAASNICFFTPPATRDEINKTIATKIYQYAIMGKPVIVSEAKMMKEFVEQNKLGIAVHSEDSDEFADVTLKIFRKEIVFNHAHEMKNWLWERTVTPMLLRYKSLE